MDPKFNKLHESKIREVADKNEIVSVVSQYLTLKKSGSTYQGLCPFHNEKSPSFNVSPQKQFFHCFGCGEGGDVISFVQKIEKVSFNEALHTLADRAGIKLDEGIDPKEEAKIKAVKRIFKMNAEAARFFYRELINKGKDAEKNEENTNPYSYLIKRGLDAATITRFGLGYAPDSWTSLINYLKSKGYIENELFTGGLISKSMKTGRMYDRFRNRIIFPIIDLKGNVIAFGGRVMDDSKPKYLNSPETPVYHKGSGLYGLNFLKDVKNLKDIILVEGYMDVITMHHHGFQNTVASLGTAFTEQQAKHLDRFANCNNVIIAYDADLAGQNATEKGLKYLENKGCSVKVLKTPSGKDPDEYLRKEGSEAMAKALEESLPILEYQVDRCKVGLDMTNQYDRLKFITRAVPYLAKINSITDRDYYIRIYARTAMVTEVSVNEEINRVKGIENRGSGVKFAENRNIAEDSEEKIKADRLTAYRKKLTFSDYRAEAGLVATALMSIEASRKVLDLVKTEDFSDALLKKIIIFIKNEIIEGKMPTVVEIFNSMNEEERQIASAVLISEVPESGVEIIEALAAIVRRNSAGVKLQRLNQEMNQLYEDGKMEEANDLFIKIRDLQKLLK